jgi:hypothetical protein
MAVPMFVVNGHDYAKLITELKPSRNDVDSDGSGRNLLDGLMYRSRLATKRKWSVTFDRLDAKTMMQLENDMYGGKDYISITLLDARVNRGVTSSYYFSTINEGVQRSINGKTYYDGVTFDIIER